ncbi:zinc-ribbon domain-containing protein [Megasphaera sueciensis]|uniref:zinc ribbon domain-containing protein n=1 Tax=Megasphaera sueciensis TaxID=349094 RepID=UPI003D03CE9F
MKKQFCTKCGAPLREDAKFCVKCGTPVKSFDEGKTNVSSADNLKIKNERPPIIEKSDNIVLDKNVAQNSDMGNEDNEDPLSIMLGTLLEEHPIQMKTQEQSVGVEQQENRHTISGKVKEKSKLIDDSLTKQSVQTEQSNCFCPYCFKLINEDENICPHCGARLLLSVETKAENRHKNNDSNNNLPDTSNKMAFYTVILIVVLFFAGYFYCYKNNIFSQPVNITAEQLMGDYRRIGSLAADKKYKGEKLAISGTVVRISDFTNADKIGDFSDTDKTKCITLYQWSYNGTRYVVNLGVPSDRKEIINNIHVGDHIVATGNFLGFSEQQKGLSIFVIGMNTSDIKKQ